MKHKTLIFAIFLTFCAVTFASRVLAMPAKTSLFDAQLLAQARSRYRNISRNLSKCRMTKRNDLPACEGSELRGYFSHEMPRRVIGNFYANDKNVRCEYSFWNGQLFFVRFTEERYAFSFDERNWGMNAGTIRRRTDERFYFHNGKLFRHVVEVRELKKPPRSSVTNGAKPKDEVEATRVLAEAREFLHDARNPTKD